MKIRFVTEVSAASSSGVEAASLTWIFPPMMSAAWHAAFHVSFNLDYTHLEAACDGGELWNPHTENERNQKELWFETGEPGCWPPLTGDALGTAPEAAVRFTVYGGESILYSGTLHIARTGADGGQTFYEARLVECNGLYLLRSDGNGAAIVSAQTYTSMISQDTALWKDADRDHDGIHKTIHVREAAKGQLCELSVVKADGTLLWSTKTACAHTGWNTILLYEENGKAYLMRYLPVMSRGIGSYGWAQFSVEGGPSVRSWLNACGRSIAAPDGQQAEGLCRTNQLDHGGLRRSFMYRAR